MTFAHNPVARHGQLKIEGRYLQDQSGKNIQLRGISSHGLQWFSEFINSQSLAHLRDSWKVDVVRLAMYLDEGGFSENQDLATTVERGVQLAIDAGLYVIVDWHVHEQAGYERSGDPRKYQKNAIQFFRQIAERFGVHPNLIYEIANEPRGVTWKEICEYASEVIDTIRSFDAQNLIIVGTPEWSQEVHVAERNRLKGRNLAYALHFYAGSHPYLRQRAMEVAAKGFPLFVTEWGTTESSGTGDVYAKESTEWMLFLQAEKISWINWSLCDKNEASALLREGTTPTGPWPFEQLSESGRLVHEFLLDSQSGQRL